MWPTSRREKDETIGGTSDNLNVSVATVRRVITNLLLVPLLATFASWCDTPSWVHGLVG